MGAIARALRRPGTYLGHAREALSTATAVASYPLGVIDAAITCGRPSGDAGHDTPVVLVHGFGHNRSGWFLLDRRLRKAGFTSVHTVNYWPVWRDFPGLAAELGERVERIRAATGSEHVHVVGHSLGGVLLRWYIQELGGENHVGTAVTVASPHEGSRAAAAGLVFGRVAWDLLPGSWLMHRLATGARTTPVRWLAYYSNIDLLMQPASSAMIRHPALRATNVLVKDQGHLSIMASSALGRSVVQQLDAAEGAAGVASLARLPSRDLDIEHVVPIRQRRDQDFDVGA